MKRCTYAILLLSSVLLFFCDSALAQNPDMITANEMANRYNAHADTTVYDFELKDETGKAIHLSDFRGKLVLINFWFTTCGPCIVQIPHERAFYAKISGIVKNLAWINISIDISADQWKDFLKKNEMPGIQLLSPQGSVPDVHKQLYVSSYPTYILMDSKGLILGHKLPKVNEMNGVLMEYMIVKGAEGVKSGDAFRDILAGKPDALPYIQRMIEATPKN